jgi:hypothetical protein
MSAALLKLGTGNKRDEAEVGFNAITFIPNLVKTERFNS